MMVTRFDSVFIHKLLITNGLAYVPHCRNEGDTVFDPFMGVASTGVASLKLNRKFVGIELEELYFNASKKRLSETSND